MKYSLAAIVLCVALSGCSIPLSLVQGGLVSPQPINQSGKVMILSVPNGREQGQDPAVGSGRHVMMALANDLVAHRVTVSFFPSLDLTSAFAAAQQQGFAYVLSPSISLWEDNATIWSGNGDKLTLSLEMYDASTQKLVAIATHRRVATGATMLNQSPDRFIDEACAGSLSKIYGWPAK